MNPEDGTATEIPVLNLTSSSPHLAQEILDAASTHGFLFVENHNIGIPPEDIDEMFTLSREFFSSARDVKEECSVHSSKSGKNRGWIGMHTETLDPAKHKRGDFKEAFNFGEFINDHAQQPLPTPLAAREARIGRFTDQCHSLCNRILRLFARALEIPDSEGGEEWFSQRHDRSKGPSGSIMRLLYYPSLKSTPDYNAEEDIRAGAHSDYGSVTLLFRLPHQPGLEILSSPPGTQPQKWTKVPLNPTCNPDLPILVNIGDLLSYWTNGLLKSTVHRVVFPPPSSSNGTGSDDGGEDRYSIAYFCHPLDAADLVAVPSEKVRARKAEVGTVGYGGGIAENGGDEEGVITAKDHLERRLKATYGL